MAKEGWDRSTTRARNEPSECEKHALRAVEWNSGGGYRIVVEELVLEGSWQCFGKTPRWRGFNRATLLVRHQGFFPGES